MQKAHDGENVSLEDLRWVVRAASAGSLSRAARLERVAQSTVSRAVARAEATLGVRLFERTGRTFRATDVGTVLLERAQEVLAGVDDLSRLAAETVTGASGEVRLSLCSTLGRHVLLGPVLSWAESLGKRGGAVSLDVRFEEHAVDPVAAGVDVVVRAGRPPDSEIHRTVLGDYGHSLVAAPALARRMGALSEPSELARHPTLAIRLERPWTTWVFHRARETARISVSPRLVVTDAGALFDSCLAGHGATVLPDYLALEPIRRGELVLLLPRWSLPRIPVLAFHAPRRRAPRLVRDCIDVLTAAFRHAVPAQRG